MASYDRYVRLDENGSIIESCVYESIIQSRAHPLEWYTPVVYKDKPEVQPYYTLQEILTVSEDRTYVTIDYKEVPCGLDYLFMIVEAALNPESEVAGFFSRPQEITDDLINRIRFLVKAKITEELNVLALQREYDNIVSLISYENDEDNENYKAEAVYGRRLRGQCWKNLSDFYTKVVNKEVELPTTYSDFIKAANIPEITWEKFGK